MSRFPSKERFFFPGWMSTRIPCITVKRDNDFYLSPFSALSPNTTDWVAYQEAGRVGAGISWTLVRAFLLCHDTWRASHGETEQVYFFAHVMAIVRSHPHDLMES
jgi:hypothetical protein